MVRAAPRFESDEAWFRWLRPKLRAGHWSSRQTRFSFWQFFVHLADGNPPRPDAAARFLSARVDELVAEGDARSVERLGVHASACADLTRHQRRPAVAALFRKLSGDAGGARADYVFSRARGRARLEALDAVATKQVLVAAGRYLGGSFRTMPSMLKKLRADPDDADTPIERWTIALRAKPRTPLYAMWTFAVDNGTVFPIGEPRPVGVSMTQGTFRADRSTPELRALARDLQRTVPF